MILTLAIMVVSLVANWRIFEKMGRKGWESIIPFYNIYVQFELLYNKGTKMFLMLIPFYGIYIMIKFYIDLAHAFNQSTGFGWGLALLNIVFVWILAFGQAEYLDGSYALTGEGTLEGAVHKKEEIQAARSFCVNVDALDKLINAIEKLAKLHEQGILTDEEFQQKKTELLAKM